MWVARNKDGSLELFEGRPYRMDKESVVPEEYREGHWAYYSIHSVIGPHTIQYFSSKMLDANLFPELKWEDEPIEVMIESLEELRKGQIELKNVYHELIDYKTKQIESLTRVFRGVALEDVADILNDLEEKIHSKYKMIGNPYCSQNCRMVTIPYSSIQLGDNSLHEYIIDDKVVVTIYVRRNDFNTADILVSDLGGEYKFKERVKEDVADE